MNSSRPSGCHHQKGLTASQVWSMDRSRAFLLEWENGMGHPTGTGILQPSSHQRAAKWTPAVLNPPISPLAKPASCHTFRHAFATHRLEDGYDLSACDAPASIRTVHERLGHPDSIYRPAVFVARTSRGVGGGGREAPHDPD